MCGTSRWHLQAAADENYGLSGSWVEAYGFRFPGVGFLGLPLRSLRFVGVQFRGFSMLGLVL